MPLFQKKGTYPIDTSVEKSKGGAPEVPDETIAEPRRGRGRPRKDGLAPGSPEAKAADAAKAVDPAPAVAQVAAQAEAPDDPAEKPPAVAARPKSPAPKKGKGTFDDRFQRAYSAAGGIKMSDAAVAGGLTAIGLGMAALDTPVWRLDADEAIEMAQALGPLAREYEEELRPYVGVLMLAPTIIGIVGPRIKVRMAMRDPEKTGITIANCRLAVRAAKGVLDDSMKGKESIVIVNDDGSVSKVAADEIANVTPIKKEG